MPASMMSAAVGSRLNVIGSSIAMVAVEPMPGSTPIRVPSSTPIRQYIRFSGETATCRPRARLASASIPQSTRNAGQSGNGRPRPVTKTSAANTASAAASISTSRQRNSRPPAALMSTSSTVAATSPRGLRA